MMQYVAVCCSCVAVCCSILQYVAVCYSVLQRIAVSVGSDSAQSKGGGVEECKLYTPQLLSNSVVYSRKSNY